MAFIPLKINVMALLIAQHFRGFFIGDRTGFI